MVALIERGPIVAKASEQADLAKLDALLHAAASHGAKLIAVNGDTVQLPDTVMFLLQQVTHCLASGQMLTLVPIDKELTTQQAADILNVSRPHVVKLLDEGAMPFTKIRTHRRIRFDDLMAYKGQRDAARHAALIEITRLGEEMDELEGPDEE